MDILGAGLTLVYGFGLFDDVTKEEEDYIIAFADSFKELGFTQKDIDNQWAILSQLNQQGLADRFSQAIDYFKTSVDHEVRIGMLDSIMYLLLADGKVSDSEGEYFQLCCESWGIDFPHYIDGLEKAMKESEKKESPKKKSKKK